MPPAPGGYPPPGPGFQQPPGYPAPPPPGYGVPYKSQTNGMALAALILGIIGVLSFWMIGFGALPGLIAVILGVIGVKKAKETGVGAGQAKAGVVLGVVAVVASIAFIVFLVNAADDADFNFEGINTDPSDGVCNTDRFFQDPDC